MGGGGEGAAKLVNPPVIQQILIDCSPRVPGTVREVRHTAVTNVRLKLQQLQWAGRQSCNQ